MYTEEPENNIILGQVNLDIIKEVKQNVKIPVIGNGDIKCAQDAIKMFEYTGVDGIMMGRAALGAPWIIQDIINELNGIKSVKISNDQKLQIIKEHLNLAIEEKGEYIAIREMRKHICWYIKNLKDSSTIREKVNKIEQTDELVEVLEEYFNNI